LSREIFTFTIINSDAFDPTAESSAHVKLDSVICHYRISYPSEGFRSTLGYAVKTELASSLSGKVTIGAD